MVVVISAVDASAAPSIFECIDSHRQVVFTDSPLPRLACRPLKFFSSVQSLPPPSVQTSALSTSKSSPAAAHSHVAPAPGDSAVAVVPVERLGNILVVSATLNGSRQARLIVDTGASQTVISQRMALDLGLYAAAHNSHVLLHTAGGNVQADSVLLDSLRIAGAEMRNSQVLIHDLPDLPLAVDGLLGLSFLGAYQVTLDIARGELILKASQPKPDGLPGTK
jgi:clan AA aspartic protease (TIGR02281 family)